MANPWAGEVAIRIDGERQVLRLTLGALAELETQLGAEGPERAYGGDKIVVTSEPPESVREQSRCEAFFENDLDEREFIEFPIRLAERDAVTLDVSASSEALADLAGNLWVNIPLTVLYLALAGWISHRGMEATKKLQYVLVVFQLVALGAFAVAALVQASNGA